MPTSDPVILVVGSLHHDIMIDADHLPGRDETAVGSRWYPKFGGKGGNQAVAARRTGRGARMVGAVGNDAFGQFILAALQASSVDHRFVRVLPDAPSGMSVAVCDAGGDYAATIVSGANLLIADADIRHADVWSDVAVLVLQNEVPDATNLAAAEEARRRGVPVILNAAPARALPKALKALVDILIVNAVEAEMMGAGPVTSLATAAKAAEKLASSFETVVVTAGGAGLAAWAMDDQQILLPAEKVDVVSTHGAGDAFVGALAASVARRLPFAECCAAASKSAARHVAGKSQDG